MKVLRHCFFYRGKEKEREKSLCLVVLYVDYLAWGKGVEE